MANDLGVRLLIEAENRASGELDKLRQQMNALERDNEALLKGLKTLKTENDHLFKALQDVSTAANQAATTVNTQLSPAMSVLATGMGGLTVAASQLAGMIAKDLVDAWLKAREEQEKWASATAQGNVSKMTALVNEHAEAVRKLGRAYNELANRQPGERRLSDLLYLGAGGPTTRREGAQQSLQEGIDELNRRQLYLNIFNSDISASEGNADAQGLTFGEWRRKQAETAAVRAERERLARIRRRYGTDLGGDESLAYSTTPLDQLVSQQGDAPLVMAYRRGLLRQRLEAEGEPGFDEGLAFKPGTGTGVERALREREKFYEKLDKEILEQAQKMKEGIERIDPLAGWVKGFDDVAKAAESSGQIMQDFARSTASTMQMAFSNLFFNVITGQFKSLADVGKQFGLAMARNFSDALATSATAPILRGLAGLSGFFPDSGMSLLNIAPGATAQVNALQRAGYSFSGDGMYASTTGPRAGAGSIYPGLYPGGSPSGGAVYGVGTADIPAAGPTAGGGDYAGLLTGGIGLGLGVLAATSTGTTAAAFGAASVGYSAGAGLATLFGASSAASAGVGALVGVVAMVAAVAIMDATSPKNARPQTGRRMLELGHVVDADTARIRQTTTFLELAEAIRMVLHQAYGGPALRGTSLANAGYAVSIGGRGVILPGGQLTPTMTLAEFAILLRDNAETFTARLQAGLPEQIVQQISQNLEQVVRTQIEVINQFRALQISYEETAPGLRRTTILPGAALDTITPGTYALSLNRSAGAAAGLTPELLDLIGKGVAQRNIITDRVPDFSRELQFIL